MTQYLLAVHGPEEQYDTPLEDMQASFEATGKFNDKIVAVRPLGVRWGPRAPELGHRRRQHRGQERRHRRPVPRGKEHIGGFWVIEAKDLDEALALAAEASQACEGTVEVRPFQAEPEG